MTTAESSDGRKTDVATREMSVHPAQLTAGSEDRVVGQFLLAVESEGPHGPTVAAMTERYPFLAAVLAEVQGFERRVSGAPPVGEFLSPGDRLGDFVIRRRVNQGGMGVIYEAVQESLGRPVALKTIRPQKATALARERFERERLVLAKLHETHVVAVLASGSAGDIEYFAMPFIGGESVRVLVADSADGPLPRSVADLLFEPEGAPPREVPLSYYQSVARFLIPLAEAMHRVHALGVLHRDLTPSNVMVDERGDGWVIDFGLAADRGTNQPAVGSVSTLGSPSSGRFGTPRYMAPEQQYGFAGVPADVWGLGVVMWELLALRPFDRNDLIAATALGAVPRSLAAVCRKATALDAEDRYPTAQALADDLRRWLAHEPVAARRHGYAERAKLWVRRNPVKATAAAALVLITLTSLVLTQQARASRNAESTARGIAEKAQGDLAIALDRATDGENRARAGEERAKIGELSAREQKRLAELRQADGECLSGAIAARAGEYDRAHALFRSARLRFTELGGDPFLARAGATAANLISPSPLLRISVPNGGMRSLAVSADGRSAVVSHTRETFDLYDLTTGRAVRQFKGGHTQLVASLALSANGKRAASGGLDGRVCLWDVETGQKLDEVADLGAPVTAVALSFDGGTVAAGTGYLGEMIGGLLYRNREGLYGRTKPVDARLVVRNAAGVKTLNRAAAHKATITSLALSLDGKHLVSGGHDDRVIHWDAATGEQRKAFGPTGAPVEHVTLAPDNLVAVAACLSGSTYLCDLTTGKGQSQPLLTLNEKTGTILDAVGSPDFSQAAFSTRDGAVYLFDAGSRRFLRSFAGPGGGKRVNRVAFLAGGLLLLASDEFVEVYPTGDDPALRALPGRSPARAWAVSADGTRALSAHSDGLARVWNLSPDRLLGPLGVTSARATVALSNDGELALVAGAGLRLFRTATGELLATLSDKDEATCASFAPDGKRVVAGRADGTIRAWAVADRRSLWEIPPGPVEDPKGPKISLVQLDNGRQVLLPPDPDEKPSSSPVSAVVFSPDGARVLTVAGNAAAVRDAATGRHLFDLAGSNRGGFAYSPDGRWIAGTGPSDSGRVELVVWDAATGKQAHLWPLVFASAPRAAAVGFSPDGRHLTALLGDGTLVAVGREDGREMHSFQLPVPHVASAAFAAQTRLVVLTDGKGISHVYDLAHAERVWKLADGLPAAQAALADRPDDPKALAELGRWYALRGVPHRSAPLLAQAGAAGKAFAPDLADALLRRDDFGRGDWAEARRLLGLPSNGALRFDALPDGLRDVFATGNADSVVSASADGKAVLLSGVTARVERLRVVGGRLSPVLGAQLSGGPAAVASDGSVLVGADKSRLLLLDVTKHPPQTVRELTSPAGSHLLRCVAISPDGKTALAGYKDGRVVVWGAGEPRTIPVPAAVVAEVYRADPKLARWVKRLESVGETLPLGVHGLAFDSASGLVAVAYGYGEGAGYPGYCALYDAATGEPRGGHLLPSCATVAALVGNRAAFGTQDGTLFLCAVTDGKLARPRPLNGHVGPVRAVALDADRVYSGGADQDVIVWEWATGERGTSFRHRAPVSSVVAVGGQLITTATDGRAYLWNVK